MSRRLAREVALKLLFGQEFVAADLDEAFARIVEEEPLEERDALFSKTLIHGVSERCQQIDEIISEFAVDWRLERLGKVERTLLRMALCELLWVEDIPPNVTVNEAVELAKIFSGPEAGRFVNGILGNVLNHLRALKSQVQGAPVNE